jgi:acylphosphatase
VSNRKAVHVTISGRVQGVGFRAWAKSSATKAGLNGWVRNRSEGTVEAVFSGKSEHVDTMLIACKDGPLASRVTDLQSEEWPDAVPSGFELKGTV